MLEPSDLSSLAALDALLQEASVSRAARRLGLSTPAMSHALARLRERFGDPLLVRAGRTMVLTPRAEALQSAVREAVQAAGRVFTEEPDFDPERMRRSLRLSVTDYVLTCPWADAHHRLWKRPWARPPYRSGPLRPPPRPLGHPPEARRTRLRRYAVPRCRFLLTMFGVAFDEAIRTRAPGLDLRFIPNAVDDPERLRTGETDLAIGIYGELPPELKTRPIISDRLVCVVRHGHPVVKRRLTLPQFLTLEHIQVAPRGQPGGYVDELLEARGEKRRVARAIPYFRAALDLVASSDRILTVSERIAQALAPSLGLDVLEPPLPLEPFVLSMVWHPRLDSDPGHRWLRERLLEVTQAMDALAHPRGRRRLGRRDPTGGQRGR